MPLLDLYSLWTGPPAAVVASGVQVLYQADILIDGVAASTEFSAVKVTISQDLKDVTRLSDQARWSVPLRQYLNASGTFYVQAGDGLAYDELIDAGGIVFTIGHDQAVGDLAFLFRGLADQLGAGAERGEVLRADVSMVGGGTGRCVMGRRLLRAQQSASSGFGTAVQLGAVSSGQTLYSALHVVGTTSTPAGTTFSVVSSPDSTLATTTTRVTFVSGTSARNGEWGAEVAGPVTDTWWAAKWTGFAGTAFTAAVSAGIE